MNYIGEMILCAEHEDVTDRVASNIVGDTIANNTVDVRQYYDKYPALETIVELAADLEVMSDYTGELRHYVDEDWSKLVDTYRWLSYRIRVDKEKGDYPF